MNEWMEHPDLANLDPAETGADPDSSVGNRRQNGKALVPVMMSLITGANKRESGFTLMKFR